MTYKPGRQRWHAVALETLFNRYVECQECSRVTRHKDAKPLIHKGGRPRA